MNSNLLFTKLSFVMALAIFDYDFCFDLSCEQTSSIHPTRSKIIPKCLKGLASTIREANC